MPMRLLPLAITLASILLSSCAVPIKNFGYCAPVEDVGAACDEFLESHQEILEWPAWKARLNEWGPVVVTKTENIISLKAEVEKLCSRARCTRAERSAKAVALEGLERIIATSERAHGRGTYDDETAGLADR
jgi:hypothetical protein